MMNYEDVKLRANAVAILYQIGAIKFEKHILASGEETPVYLDMRLVISSPEVLQTVATLIWRLRPSFNSSLLCGVPYTALTLATCISLKYNIPMVLRRKELQSADAIKVEGLFTPGQTCLVINDIVSSGKSIIETATALEENGLVVHEALVFLDRREQGSQLLGSQGIKVSSVFTIPTLIKALITYGKLNNDDLTVANKLGENLGIEI